MKWIDPEAVGSFMNDRQLLRLDRHDPLDLDVTALAPDDAAARILDHIATR